MPGAGRSLDLGFGALAAAQLAAAAVLVPRGDAIALPGGGALGGTCLSRELFGVGCPSCGMSRSFVALAHGRLGAAIDFHPAGPLLLVAMLAMVVATVAVAVRRAPPLFERSRFRVALEVVVLVCMAAGAFNMMRS